MSRVNCPLMEEKIEDVICFDIHMVVDGGAPEFTAPRKAIQKSNYRELCLKCPHHRED